MEELSVGTLAGSPCWELGEAELGMPNGGQQAGEGEPKGSQWIQNPSTPGPGGKSPGNCASPFSLSIYLL